MFLFAYVFLLITQNGPLARVSPSCASRKSEPWASFTTDMGMGSLFSLWTPWDSSLEQSKLCCYQTVYPRQRVAAVPRAESPIFLAAHR